MDDTAAHRPLVVIGGSAGALEPLRRIIGALPRGFDAPVCVVVHVPDDSPSALARLLARAGPLEAAFADDRQPLAAGRIAVAPPGHHLLVAGDHVRLSRGARENGARPAIDPLFRSAARSVGSRAVGVLLSGTLDDGTAGCAAIAAAGGVTLVQDPEDALFGDMPSNAVRAGVADEILPAAAMAARLATLVRDPMRRRVGMAGRGTRADSVDRGLDGPAPDLPGPGSPYACPACGGVLYERGPGHGYLCRVGHRYSPGSLASSQEAIVEDALWTALRTLDEAASLATRVRDRAATRGDRGMELRFEARRAGAQARADRIRAVLRGEDPDDLGAFGQPEDEPEGPEVQPVSTGQVDGGDGAAHA